MKDNNRIYLTIGLIGTNLHILLLKRSMNEVNPTYFLGKMDFGLWFTKTTVASFIRSWV